jgi:hypothetical protein
LFLASQLLRGHFFGFQQSNLAFVTLEVSKQYWVQGPGDKTTKADPLEAFCSGFQGSFIRIPQLVYAYFNAYQADRVLSTVNGFRGAKNGSWLRKWPFSQSTFSSRGRGAEAGTPLLANNSQPSNSLRQGILAFDKERRGESS